MSALIWTGGGLQASEEALSSVLGCTGCRQCPGSLLCLCQLLGLERSADLRAGEGQ